MKKSNAKFKEVAKSYLKLGFTPVPIGEGKIPVRPNFNKERLPEKEIEKYAWDGIGLACGSLSGGLEVIDIDLKNC